MNNHGFVRVAAASPALKVADCDYNTDEIIKLINKAEGDNISAIVFPELSITAYTCGDLFLQSLLLEEALKSLNRICDATRNLSIVALVGLPIAVSNRLYNMAVVVSGGRVMGAVPKTFLPNYNEFYEKRWFSSSEELKEKQLPYVTVLFLWGLILSLKRSCLISQLTCVKIYGLQYRHQVSLASMAQR